MGETGSQTNYFGIANLSVYAHPHSYSKKDSKATCKNKYNIKQNKNEWRIDSHYITHCYELWRLQMECNLIAIKLLGLMETLKVTFY